MDYENSESFQQQALQVREPDENYDPSVEPQDGEEYLTKVVYERRTCPAIVVATPPKESINNSISMDLSETIFGDEIIDTSPLCLRPTPQWIKIQLKDFDSLRQKIINARHKLAISGYASDDNMPLTNDANLWKTFCQNNEPLLSIILRIDQRSLEKLLRHEVNWLQNECTEDTAIDLFRNEKWLGAWIYATLICLHLPLEPDIFSALRSIAKLCILHRNKLSPDDVEKVAPLNLFILIISRTFSQLDLSKLYVKIQLELNAITCPGVWLCPTGFVEITIKSLGYYFKSAPMEPRFPILCHDRFIMEGYFKSITSLNELKKVLFNENIEIILWQNSRRLAYYFGTLGEILYSLNSQCHHRIIEILMITSKCFPGVIAPKIELTVYSMIQSGKFDENKQIESHLDCDLLPAKIIIPSLKKPKSSYHDHDKIHEFRRQKPVCHTKLINRKELPSNLDLQKRRKSQMFCNKCVQTQKSSSMDNLLNRSYQSSVMGNNEQSKSLLSINSRSKFNSPTYSQQLKSLSSFDGCGPVKRSSSYHEDCMDHDHDIDDCPICKVYYETFH